MDNREPVYKYYRPAWKSFYASYLLMILVIVIAACSGMLGYVKDHPAITKLIWIVALIIDVLIFLSVIMKRMTMSLVLRDNPDKPEDQEVAYIVCHPTKPFSSDFRESIEIGLRNIIDIKVGQTMMQTLLNVGNIVITSSGTGQAEIVAKNIPAPADVRNEIQIHTSYYEKH